MTESELPDRLPQDPNTDPESSSRPQLKNSWLPYGPPRRLIKIWTNPEQVAKYADGHIGWWWPERDAVTNDIDRRALALAVEDRAAFNRVLGSAASKLGGAGFAAALAWLISHPHASAPVWEVGIFAAAVYVSGDVIAGLADELKGRVSDRYVEPLEQ